MAEKILVCEISGKRPGSVKERPTENIKTTFDHLIVTNNCDNYQTDWDIVKVPDGYQKWYADNIKNSENMWYAQMNRSYAIRYAKEHGYRYCIQLDDNINMFGVAYISRIFKDENLEITKKFARYKTLSTGGGQWFDDMAKLLVSVLQHTNAGMAGTNLCSAAAPSDDFINERYVYSFLCIDVERVPEVFHGDFEDDIEFRLKLAQMGIPVVQCCFLFYSKFGAIQKNDKTGCRAEYDRIGLGRGAHMRKMYGDVYKCGMSNIARSVGGKKLEKKMFRHRIKGFKLGVMVKRKWELEEAVKNLLSRYAVEKKSSLDIYANGKKMYSKGGALKSGNKDGPSKNLD